MPLAYHSQYGFFDSVMGKVGDADLGVPSDRFSSLNQLWLYLSLVNHETGFIWHYFYLNRGVQQAHNELFGYILYMPTVMGNPSEEILQISEHK
jgi:hypothetical protein